MKAVLLDRDGVINRNRLDYVTRPEEFRFLPGAIEALASLAASPFRVVVVTNQSAVGRGRMNAEMLAGIHDRMLERVHAAGGRIDGIYACPHRPEDRCPCRKPAPGLLQQAAQDLSLDLEASFLIGDAVSDVYAAGAVGCQPILVLTGHGPKSRLELARRHVRTHWIAENLLHAVTLLLTYEVRVTAERPLKERLAV
jgi:D-glycero-D-manno-heptose 1,7-bisphosphate phosphatase